jgi:hypothetical protein
MTKRKTVSRWSIHPAAVVLLVAGGLLIVLVALAFGLMKRPPDLVEVLDFNIGAITSMLLSLFVVTLFVERAVEVIVTAWREPGKRAIEEGHVPDKYAAPTAHATSDLPGSNDMLQAYTAQTMRIAGAMTMLLGILVSAVGFRVLQPLVDSDSFVSLGGLQQGVFKWTDVLVTGGLIGGGSEGIHQLMKAIIGAFETSKAYLAKKKGEFENGK